MSEDTGAVRAESVGVEGDAEPQRLPRGDEVAAAVWARMTDSGSRVGDVESEGGTDTLSFLMDDRRVAFRVVPVSWVTAELGHRGMRAPAPVAGCVGAGAEGREEVPRG